MTKNVLRRGRSGRALPHCVRLPTAPLPKFGPAHRSLQMGSIGAAFWRWIGITGGWAFHPRPVLRYGRRMAEGQGPCTSGGVTGGGGLP